LTRERWPALDGLRGVAILLVILAHTLGDLFLVGGMVGVTLFFVLSGFLITNLLIEERENTGRIDLKAFYARRALRLLPALGIYLVGISTVMLVMRLDIPVFEISWPPALYVANYVQIFGMDLMAHRHTWSLAVEEHFYLVWPVLVGLGAARRARSLGIVVLLLIGWRLAVHLSPANPLWAYAGTDTNAYALGIGALVAAVRRGSGLPTPSRLVGVVTVGGLAMLGFIRPGGGVDGLYSVSGWVTIVAALLGAGAVCAAVEGDRNGFLTASTLRRLGLISYSLYLWHAPVLQLPGLSETPALRLVAAGIAIAIAWLSWHLVEGPINRSRLRQRLLTPHGPLPARSTAEVVR
jgi:peptidoglycan/LPS O-acetylase OafA/YrhL